MSDMIEMRVKMPEDLRKRVLVEAIMNDKQPAEIVNDALEAYFKAKRKEK